MSPTTSLRRHPTERISAGRVLAAAGALPSPDMALVAASLGDETAHPRRPRLLASVTTPCHARLQPLTSATNTGHHPLPHRLVLVNTYGVS